MKTTIEIADELLAQARASEMTLRSLVDEGLRLALEKHAKPVKPYKFVPVVVGKPYRPGMPVIDVNALIAETYAEREDKMFALIDRQPPSPPTEKKSATQRRKKSQFAKTDEKRAGGQRRRG